MICRAQQKSSLGHDDGNKYHVHGDCYALKKHIVAGYFLGLVVGGPSLCEIVRSYPILTFITYLVQIKAFLYDQYDRQ